MRTLLLIAFLSCTSLWAGEAENGPERFRPGFYIDAGISALIFDGPDRPIPVFETEFPNLVRRSGFLLKPYEEEDVVPAGRLSLGFVFEDTPDWMGRDFRVEASTNFWWVQTEESRRIPAGAVAATAYEYDNGTPLAAEHFVSLYSPGFAPGDTPSVLKRDSEYRYVDGNLAFCSDYRLSELITISPSLGFAYASLDYDAEVSSRSPNLVDGYGSYSLKERLDTDYVGATAGLAGHFQVTRRFTVSLGGSVSPLWSDTDAKATSVRVPHEWPLAAVSQHGLHLEDDEFTFRATGTLSLSYQPTSWFRVAAFGGVEHWDKVARIDYPNYTAGATPAIAGSGFPKIGYTSMTNYRAGLNLTFLIGK